MKKNVIVSLADSNYFELLNELVDSIKSFEKSKDIAICILDAGLLKNKRIYYQKKLMKLNQLNGILMFQHLKLREENG